MKCVRCFGLAVLGVLSLSPAAQAQYGSDYTLMPPMVQDILAVANSDGDFGGVKNVDYEFRHPTDNSGGGFWHVYRQADGDTWQKVTDNYQNQNNGQPIAGGPWYPQSLEFDNRGLLSHSPFGNMLVCNYGNGYTGFEIYTIKTTGGTGDSWSSVWSSHCEAGGTYGGSLPALSERGGGLAVSPFNDKVAWTSYDDGSLWVLDYYDGGLAAGTGMAQWGQLPVADQGVWAGNPRRSDPISGGQFGRSGTTQGTTWLNNHTVACFNGFGEIVTCDVSQIPGGSNQGDQARGGNGDRTDEGQGVPMLPTYFVNWVVADNSVSTTSQTCDIEYNPEIDPNHIYAAETTSGFVGWLHRYDYTPATGAIAYSGSWLIPAGPGALNVQPREIAFDSQGNLWIAARRNPPGGTVDGWGITKITDLPNNWLNPAAIVYDQVGAHFGNFRGMDVAKGLDILTDVTGDGVVDGNDLSLLLGNYGLPVHQDPDSGFVVDFNNDGVVDGNDLSLLLGNYGQGY